jgi:hypothetical protein
MDEYPYFIVKGIPPYDGEYEWDTDRVFTGLEWRYLREIGGYLPNTLDEGMKGDDPSLYVALAICCMVRARKVDPDDAERAAAVLLNAPWDNSRLYVRPAKKQQEADPLPLGSTPPPNEPSQNETGSSQPENSERASGSGKSSLTSSDPSDETPQPTGTIESDTADARLLRWVN